MWRGAAFFLEGRSGPGPWEWRLGSTLYVVWTQNRTSDANPGEFELSGDVGRLFGAPPDDIFLLKFGHRLGR